MKTIMSIVLENPEELKSIPECYHSKSIINPSSIPRKGDVLYLGDKGSFSVKYVSWQFNEDEILVAVTIS
jgi:hypothetical protein